MFNFIEQDGSNFWTNEIIMSSCLYSGSLEEQLSDDHMNAELQFRVVLLIRLENSSVCMASKTI